MTVPPPDMTSHDRAVKMARSNRRVAVVLGSVVAGMIGLSFASVPLYSLFCRVTGFGGTTMVATKTAERVLDRVITVQFNADVNSSLPWEFAPDRRSVDVRVGEAMTITYHARNLTDKPLVGTAAYNVTPDKVGQYFNKLQCFCFTEQRLEPGQRVEMPVNFYIDPAMADDPEMADVKTITLSYTFFRAADQSAALPPPGKGQPGDVSDGAAPEASNGNAGGTADRPAPGVPGGGS